MNTTALGFELPRHNVVLNGLNNVTVLRAPSEDVSKFCFVKQSSFLLNCKWPQMLISDIKVQEIETPPDLVFGLFFPSFPFDPNKGSC